jgi:K+/H+ antiporter YhaU regulatory subunit KhtT
MEPVPRPDYVFRKGDVLVLVGTQEDLESFTK